MICLRIRSSPVRWKQVSAEDGTDLAGAPDCSRQRTTTTCDWSASTHTGFGYFRNFGRTRRQGVELSAAVRLPRTTAGVGYSFVDATYQSAEVIGGAGNSANDSGRRLAQEDSMVTSPSARAIAFRSSRSTRSRRTGTSRRRRNSRSMSISSPHRARSRAATQDNAHQPDSTMYPGPGVRPHMRLPTSARAID